ncbi:hypothetical protein Tco_0431809 [Tanacetum coccineum]
MEDGFLLGTNAFKKCGLAAYVKNIHGKLLGKDSKPLNAYRRDEGLDTIQVEPGGVSCMQNSVPKIIKKDIERGRVSVVDNLGQTYDNKESNGSYDEGGSKLVNVDFHNEGEQGTPESTKVVMANSSHENIESALRDFRPSFVTYQVELVANKGVVSKARFVSMSEPCELLDANSYHKPSMWIAGFVSWMMSTKEYEKRYRSRRSHSPRPSPSVFLRLRRDRSRSPRPKEKEGVMFKRLGSRGRSVSARSNSHNQPSYLRYTNVLSESEDSIGGHWKSRSRKKKSSEEEYDLSQPWVCEETDPFTPRIR